LFFIRFSLSVGSELADGTLGRLRAFSVRRPKSMLDLGEQSVTPSDDSGSQQPARRSMFSGRALSYLIEECIRVIMDLEDVDSILISLGAPSPNEDPSSIAERDRLRAQRHALCSRLLESLDLSSSLSAVTNDTKDVDPALAAQAVPLQLYATFFI
jgi:hypothetical protein